MPTALRARSHWLACANAIRTIRRRGCNGAWPTSGLVLSLPPRPMVVGRRRSEVERGRFDRAREQLKAHGFWTLICLLEHSPLIRVYLVQAVSPPAPPRMPQQAFDPTPTRHSLLNRLKDWGDQTSWQDFFDT